MRSSIIHALLYIFFAFCLIPNIFMQSTDNYGPCTCDLLVGVCDINCCCDTDCTENDISVFSSCTNAHTYESVQTCLSSSIFFRNSTPYAVNSTSSSDQFCIYFNNFGSRIYYSDPEVENLDANATEEAATNYGGFQFETTAASFDYAVFQSNYTAGVPIPILYNDSTTDTQTLSFFSLPSKSSVSDSCADFSSVKFFVARNSTCRRLVTRENCNSLSGLQLSSFVTGFSVVSQPGLLNVDTNVTNNFTTSTLTLRDMVDAIVGVNQTSVVCYDTTGASVTCVNETRAELNGDVCQNVLTRLTYTMSYSSSSGIYSVQYEAEVRALNLSLTNSVQQNFAVNFNMSSSARSTSSYQRSGNPGYLPGRPVVAGTLNNTFVNVNDNSDTWLTLPTPDSSGLCNAAAAAAAGSVLFGENAQSSCSQQIDGTTNCTELNSNILNLLKNLGRDQNKRLATYGNSNQATINQWITVINDGCDNVSSAVNAGNGCFGLTTSAELEILHARTGSVTMPQERILAARLKCNTADVRIKCTGSICPSTQSFPVSFSVRFTDASSTPTSSQRQRQSISQQRVPNNFFYLLYVENCGQKLVGLSPGLSLALTLTTLAVFG